MLLFKIMGVFGLLMGVIFFAMAAMLYSAGGRFRLAAVLTVFNLFCGIKFLRTPARNY